MQLTSTLVTLPPTTVPTPPLTVHVWFAAVGPLATATSKPAPLPIGTGNTNAPSPATTIASPALFSRTISLPAASPTTAPPTV